MVKRHRKCGVVRTVATPLTEPKAVKRHRKCGVVRTLLKN